jgi:hypothetical protein
MIGSTGEGVAEPARVAEKLSVRTQGLTWLDKIMQLIVLALSPVVVFMVIVSSPPPHPTDFVPSLIVAILLLGAADLYGESIVSVRRIDIDSTGVSFHYLFHVERGAWLDLTPGPTPPAHGMWCLLRRRHAGVLFRRVPVRSHQITLEQARVTLSFPACPHWDLPPEVSRQLGVPPARASLS